MRYRLANKHTARPYLYVLPAVRQRWYVFHTRRHVPRIHFFLCRYVFLFAVMRCGTDSPPLCHPKESPDRISCLETNVGFFQRPFVSGFVTDTVVHVHYHVCSRVHSLIIRNKKNINKKSTAHKKQSDERSIFGSFVRRVRICTLCSHSRGLPRALIHLTLRNLSTIPKENSGWNQSQAKNGVVHIRRLLRRYTSQRLIGSLNSRWRQRGVSSLVDWRIFRETRRIRHVIDDAAAA